MPGKAKRTAINAKEMEAAHLIFHGDTSVQAAEKVGLNDRVLRYSVEEPYFVEYMDKLREEQEARLKKSARKAITFTRDDAAEGYLEVRNSPGVSDANKIRALDSLVALYKLIDQPAPTAPGEAPDKPTFFRAVDYMQ